MLNYQIIKINDKKVKIVVGETVGGVFTPGVPEGEYILTIKSDLTSQRGIKLDREYEKTYIVHP